MKPRTSRRAASLRRQLIIGILLPVVLLIGVNSFSLYRQALQAADTAYDRTLLASAKAIGEQLRVEQRDGVAVLQANLSYAALEPFEADNRSRIYYRVSGFDGKPVSGFDDLPEGRRDLPDQGDYAALVHFYDDEYRDVPVRMAVLLQPVAGVGGNGVAVVQVAETLEVRRSLAQRILMQTLWRQALLVLVIAGVVVLVVQRATGPVRRLSAQMRAQPALALTPVEAPDAPREWQPLVEATNQLVERLRALLEYQKRFVRDASHQLKTPLAVLRLQVQSARRGDVEPQQALAEIENTVQQASQLATQMLALAKVEQLRQAQGSADAVETLDWSAIARAVALELAPLLAERRLDFEIHTENLPIAAPRWALSELVRNLLHNAISHSPPGAPLSLSLVREGEWACLCLRDSGPGLSAEQRQRLFQPFATGAGSEGSGLGLAICHGLVESLGGEIRLDNRLQGETVLGLEARVRLPCRPL